MEKRLPENPSCLLMNLNFRLFRQNKSEHIANGIVGTCDQHNYCKKEGCENNTRIDLQIQDVTNTYSSYTNLTGRVCCCKEDRLVNSLHDAFNKPDIR